MPATRKKSRKNNVNRVKRVVRTRRKKANRRTASTPPAVIGIDQSSSIDISGIQFELDALEIASACKNDSIKVETTDQLMALVDQCYKICRKINPKFADREWREDTSAWQLLHHMLPMIIEYCDKQKVWLRVVEDDNGLVKLETYRIHGDDMAKIWYVSGLWKFKKKDPALYRIVLAMLGKMSERFQIPTWDDDLNMVSDYIDQQREEFLYMAAEDNLNPEMEDTAEGYAQRVAEIDQGLKEWEGQPVKMFHDMLRYQSIPDKRLWQMIDQRKWKSRKDRELLRWMQDAQILLDSDLPALRYMTFHMESGYLIPIRISWSEDGNIVADEANQWIQSSFENETWYPLMERFDMSNPTPPSADMKLFDKWITKSCFLF